VTLTVSVFEKHGLCKGPPIGTATFRGNSGIVTVPLAATQGGPLSGGTHVYTVTAPLFPSVSSGTPFDLRVDSPSHQPCTFPVRDGETHEVWLFPD
jgi:hypothetical protein